MTRFVHLLARPSIELVSISRNSVPSLSQSIDAISHHQFQCPLLRQAALREVRARLRLACGCLRAEIYAKCYGSGESGETHKFPQSRAIRSVIGSDGCVLRLLAGMGLVAQAARFSVNGLLDADRRQTPYLAQSLDPAPAAPQRDHEHRQLKFECEQRIASHALRFY